jgi:dephospho-CoA kinase
MFITLYNHVKRFRHFESPSLSHGTSERYLLWDIKSLLEKHNHKILFSSDIIVPETTFERVREKRGRKREKRGRERARERESERARERDNLPDDNDKLL